MRSANSWSRRSRIGSHCDRELGHCAILGSHALVAVLSPHLCTAPGRTLLVHGHRRYLIYGVGSGMDAEGTWQEAPEQSFRAFHSAHRASLTNEYAGSLATEFIS